MLASSLTTCILFRSGICISRVIVSPGSCPHLLTWDQNLNFLNVAGPVVWKYYELISISQVLIIGNLERLLVHSDVSREWQQTAIARGLSALPTFSNLFISPFSISSDRLRAFKSRSYPRDVTPSARSHSGSWHFYDTGSCEAWKYFMPDRRHTTPRLTRRQACKTVIPKWGSGVWSGLEYIRAFAQTPPSGGACIARVT